MKKTCLLFLISFLSSGMAFSQNLPDVLIDNFETGNNGWAPVDNGWVDFEIVTNPSSDAVNSSANVMKVVRKTGTNTWAGIILRNIRELTFGGLPGQYRYAHVKVLKETNGGVAFKCEKNGNNGSYTDSKDDYNPTGEWQELVFDLGGAAGTKYDDYFIMVDQTPDIAADITVYIDDIVIKEDPNAVAENPELPGVFQLVWADEFNGDTYDDDIWSPQIAGDGFGNNELQYYTGNDKNIFTREGCLVLKAYKENYSERNYTSGKLWSQNKKYIKYGRVESRFKLPQGKGTWPAIWMMPQRSAYGGWPNSGEIDIMEFVGYDPNRIHGTVHRGAGSGNNGNGNSVNVSGRLDEFHVIRIDWEPGYIKWYFNDQLFHTYNNGYAGSAQWPFDQDFYVILNFAVGGDWGGSQGIDENIWPQEFQIDYVRVYQKQEIVNVGIEKKAPLFNVVYATKENLVINTTGESAFDIDIYSLTGVKQLSTKAVDSETYINISPLPKGVYIVTATDGLMRYSEKFIKE